MGFKETLFRVKKTYYLMRCCFLFRVCVRSRCWDACMVVDGGTSFEFNDGAIASMMINKEDELRTVLLEQWRISSDETLITRKILALLKQTTGQKLHLWITVETGWPWAQRWLRKWDLYYSSVGFWGKRCSLCKKVDGLNFRTDTSEISILLMSGIQEYLVSFKFRGGFKIKD